MKKCNFRLEKPSQIYLLISPTEKEKFPGAIKQIFWSHLMEDDQTTSSPLVAVAQTLSQAIEKSIAELDVNDKMKVLKILIKITDTHPH
ncbi:MAG: hypothetical protein Q9O62_10290 [Ardenticatenia bacterium]|nr:hypothetical protein [Ardenticatenia bacterium]